MKHWELGELEEAVKWFLFPSGDWVNDGIEILEAIEEKHRDIHQLKDKAIRNLRLVYWCKGLEPESVLDSLVNSKSANFYAQVNKPVVSQRSLRASLPVSGKALALRSPDALMVIEFLIKQADLAKAEVAQSEKIEHSDGWELLLWHLYNGYRETPVCGPWERSTKHEGYESGEPERAPPANVWASMKASKEWSSVAAKIAIMMPPLTWAEVLYHQLTSLQEERDNPLMDQLRKEFVRGLFPLGRASHAERLIGEVICFECDRKFPVEKHNPGRIVCPKCNANRRQRRRRERIARGIQGTQAPV